MSPPARLLPGEGGGQPFLALRRKLPWPTPSPPTTEDVGHNPTTFPRCSLSHQLKALYPCHQGITDIGGRNVGEVGDRNTGWRLSV